MSYLHPIRAAIYTLSQIFHVKLQTLAFKKEGYCGENIICGILKYMKACNESMYDIIV